VRRRRAPSASAWTTTLGCPPLATNARPEPNDTCCGAASAARAAGSTRARRPARLGDRGPRAAHRAVRGALGVAAVGGDRGVARLVEPAQDAPDHQAVAASLEQGHRAGGGVGDHDRTAVPGLGCARRRGFARARGAGRSRGPRRRRSPPCRRSRGRGGAARRGAEEQRRSEGGGLRELATGHALSYAGAREPGPGACERHERSARGGRWLRGAGQPRAVVARVAGVPHTPLLRDAQRCVTAACDHGA
jgi:hypothetical protein